MLYLLLARQMVVGAVEAFVRAQTVLSGSYISFKLSVIADLIQAAAQFFLVNIFPGALNDVVELFVDLIIATHNVRH